MKTTPSLLAVFITSLAAIIQVTTTAEFARPTAKDFRSHWFANSNRDRNEVLNKWYENKRVGTSAENHPALPSFGDFHANHQFKGCIDPSEPFQCPQSEQCIALQFICDGHPGDCPGNFDENEETCIAAKRPAKENIEKFLHAEYTLHGSKLFTFLFGKKYLKTIEENDTFWFDTLASAFSVAKNLRSFADKTRMSPDDMAHFRNVIRIIHDGRLEEIPMFAQEAVNQGLAALIEKLYESGFMEEQ